jgi:predicted alpha/beta hydrolase family esterase
MRDLSFVFLAGIGNSEPEHWQRLWFAEVAGAGRALWVDHHDWNRVSRDRWLTELDAAIDGADAATRPLVFVAHSVGCLLAAEWMDENRDAEVRGALLVAPPDLSAERAPKGISGFRSPFAIDALPFRGVVAASENDPFASIDFARRLSAHWRMRLVEIGARGHINLESKLGRWPEGRTLLHDVCDVTDRASNG